ARQLDLRAMFPFGGSLGGSSALPFLAREAITGSRFSFGVVGLALVPAALVARRFRPLVLWALVLGALTVAFALGPLTPLLSPYLAPPPDARLPYHASTDALYRKHSAAFARLAALTGPARVWVFNREAVPEVAAKFATLSGVRSIDDYEQVNLRRQSDYFTYFAEGSTEMSREPWVFAGLVSLDGARNAARPATRRRLLDLSAVRFLVLQEASLRRAEVREFLEAAGLAPESSLPGEEPTSGEDRLVLYENPRVLPRAYVVYRTRPAPRADELLGRMSQDSFDPLVESYVEGDPGFIPAPDAPARGIAAEILRDDPRVVELRATAAAPGLAVLADTFYAGWQADVDGRPASVVATNHLFRGVPVPAGMHRVRFEYRPASARV